MQVTHVNEHVTHAVIGGSEAIEFGISNSAEFFNILSSTLYKDQILAVTREVLCNAWDAHIEAGCTDKPVQITLTEDRFTIKDFGNGIHRDDMGMIYGTYGASTKKNDGKQTGGFGLGCKAPFAYTDHFEVTSCHDGVKTIYNLSKSSAQAQGKPGIVPIASFPTPDTGLHVSIRIHNSTDYRRFLQLVRRITRNGDMNMTLNGEQVEKLGFDTTNGNYFITRSSEIIENAPVIMVRYGNVIYPVDHTTAVGAHYEMIRAHLAIMSHHNNQYRIIFQAPPHSISVTPSRESLSMQEHTVKTLLGLFEGFLDTLKGEFKVECSKVAKATVTAAVVGKRIGDLLSSKECLPIEGDYTMNAKISDLVTMATQYMSKNYPKDLAFRKEDIKFRLESMSKAGILNRGKVQSWLRAMGDVASMGRTHWGVGREDTNWLQKRIIAPLVAGLMQAKMDHKRLYVYDSNDTNASRGYNSKPPLITATAAKPLHLFSTLPYLRNIVVLAKSKHDMADRAYKMDAFKEAGKYDGFLFYHVGMKKADRDNAIAFFSTTGMTVVDLTERQPWEIVPSHLAVAAVPKKPAKVGIATFSSIKHGSGVNLHKSQEDDATRTTTPEFVAVVAIRKDSASNCVNQWDSSATRCILELFGDKGGITNSTVVYQKWIDKGAMDFEKYMIAKLTDFLTNNQAFLEFWKFNPERYTELPALAMSHEGLVKQIYASPVLRKEFNLVNNLTSDDKKMLLIWEKFRRWNYKLPTDLQKVVEHLNTIPMDKANFALFAKLKDNPLLSVINETELGYLLRNKPADSPEVKKALSILTQVINK